MDNSNLLQLRRLSSQADALKRAMEMAAGGTTEDFAKWGSYKSFGSTYNRLAIAYMKLSERTDVPIYNVEDMPSSGNVVWPVAKEYFERFFTDTLILCACLNEYANEEMTSHSEIQDLIAANLRKIIHSTPNSEIEIQNSIEALFVGRGYQKGIDYGRETGRVKYSGKEFVPDFVFDNLHLAVEVKLVLEKKKISNCIEELSADIPAYLSKYKSILFCVYDVGAIQDVVEFQNGFESQPGVRVCVVKH